MFKLFGNNQSGYTIVEVIVAVAVLALLAAAFTPLLTGSLEIIMDSGDRSQELFEDKKDLEKEILDDEEGDLEIDAEFSDPDETIDEFITIDEANKEYFFND